MAHMLRRSHEGVKVDTRPSAYRFMELGVDIVWTALERLHLEPPLRQQRHQSPGNGRLARATCWCCNHKTRFHWGKGTKNIEH